MRKCAKCGEAEDLDAGTPTLFVCDQCGEGLTCPRCLFVREPSSSPLVFCGEECYDAYEVRDSLTNACIWCLGFGVAGNQCGECGGTGIQP